MSSYDNPSIFLDGLGLRPEPDNPDLQQQLDAANQRVKEEAERADSNWKSLERIKGKWAVDKQRAEEVERKLAWALRTLRTVRHLVVGVSCCEQCFKCHQNAEMYLPIIDEALTQIEREPARASETKHAYAIQQYGADVVVDHVFQGHEKMPPECQTCGLHFLRHARVPANMLAQIEQPQSTPAEREELTKVIGEHITDEMAELTGDFRPAADAIITAGWRKLSPTQRLPGEGPPFGACPCLACQELRAKT